ncbi:YwaF family protein [Clostridium sp.]|uniref:TMEM164 family acyltransferase n=1 Tax=Clostridium sp. TaxID=1506 RepID=UPI00260731B5|nr:YwaF family protein [Clostridium sp.]
MAEFKLSEFIVRINESDNYIMNSYERYAPFIIVFILIIIIVLSKDIIIINKRLEKKIRYMVSFITGGVLCFYYLGNWVILGIDINNLPFHLCYLCTILSIIVGLSKNKRIFNFILVCGFIGGIGSFISMDISLSSSYLKYYKFIISHIVIIMLPIYFIVIHKYKLKVKDLLEVFIELEILSIIMGIFNSQFKTSYFFVSFTSNIAAKGTVLENIGEGYKYFINLELMAVLYFFVIFIYLKFLEFKERKKESNYNIGRG